MILTFFMELEKKLNFKDLLIGLVGVSPIPVLGEIGLSYFFYRILEGKETEKIKHVSIPAALLTRIGMYKEFYIPLYEKLRDVF